MKSIIILLMYIGISMIIVGYMKNYQKCDEPKIEYRYVPRTFFEEQIAPTDLKKSYSGMFNNKSTWQTYPLNSDSIDSTSEDEDVDTNALSNNYSNYLTPINSNNVN